MTLKKTGLQRFRKEIGGAIDRGVERAATFVADLASQLAPFDADATHKHLNESIEVQGQPGSHRRKVVAGVGLSDARAPAQEYGTVDSPAQPYLTPAAEQIDVAREIKAEIAALANRSTS